MTSIYKKAKKGTKKGFTLVEILIVVIILGILAAIVIPQFTNASTDARNNSTTSLLQTLRSQVELYKLQHGDVLPNLIGNAASAWTPLTTVTQDTAGNDVGPYLQSVPRNPQNGQVGVQDGNASFTNAAATTGWVYDYANGDGSGRVLAVDDAGAVFAE